MRAGCEEESGILGMGGAENGPPMSGIVITGRSVVLG